MTERGAYSTVLNRSNVHPRFFKKYETLINQSKVIVGEISSNQQDFENTLKGLSETRSNSVFKEDHHDSSSNVVTSPQTRSFYNNIVETETPIPLKLNRKLRNQAKK